ncbi:protein-glutamate O-methyltransferase CheR [Vibrio sp. SM6]|uniref:Chemotaxis protein methyltransferase n=1 Tax=Vibrio agarilyticus TaxID=2726741 RepID=A0A7X8YFR3_9VIBR|nr:protein-glutamate O-methyltransferase CheR [Vibrio agarilyticus]NLS11934.1 protein-glutamate O-methyltransferase CheR [Vibrio agarilyticus]
MGRVLALAENEEFELTDQDYKFIQWFIHKNVGIFLSDQKRNMVYGRVSRKLREKGLRRFADYRQCIESDEQDRRRFINAITTNKTHFFRESHHIDFLEQQLVPKWRGQAKRSISIWSAGCSTGEEPYSYLAALKWTGMLEGEQEVTLLATDLDTDVLATAAAGVYPQAALDSIPHRYLKGAFLRGCGAQQGKIKVQKSLQQYVRFCALNLLDAWPSNLKFDLISCRNVLIYFDKETQQNLIHRFYQHLHPDGVLFLGHSESVGAQAARFQHLGKTIYTKDHSHGNQ